MMMSMGLGMAFVVAVRAVPRLAASTVTLTMTGMMFGLAVWAVMQYGIWPAIDAAAAPRFTPWVFAVGHLMFGAATALLTGITRHGSRSPYRTCPARPPEPPSHLTARQANRGPGQPGWPRMQPRPPG